MPTVSNFLKFRSSGFNPRDFSGRSVGSPNFRNESEKETFDTISSRSRGEGVGFDPERRKLQEDLVTSQLERIRGDRTRDARANLASAGLSGNARAIDATTGRINRDLDTDLANSLARISIEDLTAANSERDINTARLAQFNQSQAAQDLAASQFDLEKFNAENQADLEAASLALRDRQVTSALQNQALQRRALKNQVGGGEGKVTRFVKDLDSASRFSQSSGLANRLINPFAQFGGQGFTNDQFLFNQLQQQIPAIEGNLRVANSRTKATAGTLPGGEERAKKKENVQTFRSSRKTGGK